jgi:hypothetical protein
MVYFNHRFIYIYLYFSMISIGIYFLGVLNIAFVAFLSANSIGERPSQNIYPV